MPKKIETERLILRPLVLNDFQFMCSLQGDAEVMKYISGGTPRTEAEVKLGIDRNMQMQRENPLLGMWVVELKFTKQTIGCFVLRNPATQDKMEGVEIGFSFLKSFWGKGYASESVARVIQYVHQEMINTKILALIDTNNQASFRLLLQKRFKKVGESIYLSPYNGAQHLSEVLEYSPKI